MAHALVRWSDQRTSVIPLAWVVHPKPLPPTLPVEGRCYWKRKSKLFDVNVLASAESKQELEDRQELEDLSTEAQQEASLKEVPVASSCTGTATSTTTTAAKSLTNKEARKLEKQKKQARIVAAQNAAAKIFTIPSNCENCDKIAAELKEVQHTLKEKEGLFDNLEQSKKRTIKNLETQLKAKKAKVTELENELKTKTVKMAAIDIPTISHQTLQFLDQLSCFYHEQAQYINSDESSDEDLSPLEIRRANNIVRNKAALKEIDKFLARERTTSSANFVLAASTPPMTSTPTIVVSSAMTSTPIIAVSAPVTSTPIIAVSAPVTSTSIIEMSAPVTPTPAAPVTSTPIVVTSAPVTSTPIIVTPAPVTSTPIVTSGTGARTIGTKQVSRTYSYEVTPADLAKEQQAFQPGEGKKELVEGFGVYIRYVDLEMAEQQCKNSPTGLMRALIAVWYNRERLAACSMKSGINDTIKTAVFKYCEKKFNLSSIDKLKHDLTSKCGEERRKMLH